VILGDGRLLAYVERGGRRLVTMAEENTIDAVAAEITALARRRYRRMTVETIDGAPAAQTPLGTALLAGSFVQGYRGISFRERVASRRSPG